MTKSPPTEKTSVLSSRIRRVLAPNAGPYTSTGTCTYIVGNGNVAVIDPGPLDETHMAHLLEILKHETLTHIFVTHTHKDHSPAARALQLATGAPILGCGPHISARPLAVGEVNLLESSGDKDHQPDVILKSGDIIESQNWTLEALETPGHTANHLCFSLKEEHALFSGDHVMGWSTTMIAPPDGHMRDYMNSLDQLQKRTETIYWPGHGGAVTDPARYVRSLLKHRRQREAAIFTGGQSGAYIHSRSGRDLVSHSCSRFETRRSPHRLGPFRGACRRRESDWRTRSNFSLLWIR
jgi:glyoxylase-like metal-dependent hydrolase (beta-lactamase superfamily II)